MDGTATTDDALLDGRVRLRQPAAGYRVAIDPVLLAAAVPARRRHRVLDAGAGVGAAALCLAARATGVTIVGLELQADLADLFRSNVGANGMSDRIAVATGDLFSWDKSGEPFDQVMTNPPYRPAGRGRPSGNVSKERATVEADFDLAGWISACLDRLRPKGLLTIVHEAARLDDLIAALTPRAGDIRIVPLWPKPGEAARRIIVQARLGVRSPATLLPGLVLHRADGGFTPEAERILRAGEALSTGK